MDIANPGDAREDSLTGLPNRDRSYAALGQAVERASHSGGSLAVLLLDLDHFRDTNDTLGHPAGDALLVAVARRLETRIGAGATLGRLGGDEFVILVEDAGSRDALAGRASDVVAAFRLPFRLDGHEVSVTASLGIAVYPEDGMTVEDLLRHAEIAMYKAKAHARDGFRFFEPESARETTERVRLVQELRTAVRDDSLALVYQPQFDLASGELLAAEALLRWRHAAMGDVNPERLIHAAEASGLIHELGDWVLDQVCLQLRQWQEEGLRTVPVAVNLSAMQLGQPGAAARLLAPLARHNVPSHLLAVEITESALLESSSGTLEALHELHNQGVKVVLDDFGTGFSSLVHLRQYPVSAIKVDSSFVRGVGTSTHDEQIIEAVLGLARGLGLAVVAEGVETAAQADFLRSRGCAAAQGFLYGRPVPAERFAEWLRGAKARGEGA